MVRYRGRVLNKAPSILSKQILPVATSITLDNKIQPKSQKPSKIVKFPTVPKNECKISEKLVAHSVFEKRPINSSKDLNSPRSSLNTQIQGEIPRQKVPEKHC